MNIYAIYCPESKERADVLRQHIVERMLPAVMVPGIHGRTFGVLGTKIYQDGNTPKRDWVIGYAQTGLFLSHYVAWSIVASGSNPSAMIIEDDADFPEDWHKRIQEAMENVPGDWDIIVMGGSHTSDKPKTHVKGPIWEVKYPFCTHAYAVRKEAASRLMQKVRDVSSPIDIAMISLAYPHLRVYTVLPRIVNQRGLELYD